MKNKYILNALILGTLSMSTISCSDFLNDACAHLVAESAVEHEAEVEAFVGKGVGHTQYPVWIGVSYHYENTWANIGETSNKGIDITLNTVNITNKDFSWTTSLNVSYQKDKIDKLANGKVKKVVVK